MLNQKVDNMTKEKVAVLKVADRCDRCNSQAFVLVKGVTGELMFCGHHYAKNEKALEAFAYEIIDERDRLAKVYSEDTY